MKREKVSLYLSSRRLLLGPPQSLSLHAAHFLYEAHTSLLCSLTIHEQLKSLKPQLRAKLSGKSPKTESRSGAQEYFTRDARLSSAPSSPESQTTASESVGSSGSNAQDVKKSPLLWVHILCPAHDAPCLFRDSNVRVKSVDEDGGRDARRIQFAPGPEPHLGVRAVFPQHKSHTISVI